MADQLGSAVLTLSVDDKQFNAGLAQAQRQAQTAAEGLRSALGSLGVATTVGGIAAFVGNQVTQLDAASAAVRTLGVDSAELGARLRALSIELGSNISTVELTKAAYDVASSGFATAADAADILRASALGATGGFAQVNDVASALTGVLNAYGLSASEAGRIVDQFVQTQADGVITVRQYAAEIGNVASIAAASGIKIEELNAAIATATLRGVPVAQTFTGLRQAISNIIKPSQQATELAQSLGIQFNVNALQAKGLGGVLGDVQAKTGGAADKIAILLGSVEAQAAIQPLLNDNLVKYNELLGKQAQAAGAAADASKINATTISGGLKQIGNGFANLATTLDTTLTPLFAGFIKSINDILTKLNQVSALSPEKVRRREQEAVAAVEAQSNPFQRTGFLGGVEVKYGGKVYKGTATGVRDAIVQDLLNQELQTLNKASRGGTAGATGPGPTKPPGMAPNENELWAKRIAAANKLLDIQEQTTIEAQKSGLNDSGVKALQALTAFRSTVRAEQNAQAMLKVKPIDPEAQNAVKEAAANTVKASLEARNNLQEAFKAAQDSVRTISRGIEDSTTQLLRLQGGNSGLNQFLRGQALANNQQLAFQQLLPQFQRARELAAQDAERNGNPYAAQQFRGLNFSGDTAGVNQRMLDFIDAQRGQDRLMQDLAASNAELVKANASLAVVTKALNDSSLKMYETNTRLAAAIDQLADKDWNVQVSVASDGSTSAYGDLVNGAVTQ